MRAAEQALGHSKPSLLEKYQKQKQASASGRPKDSSLDEDWSEEGDSKVGEVNFRLATSEALHSHSQCSPDHSLNL